MYLVFALEEAVSALDEFTQPPREARCWRTIEDTMVKVERQTEILVSLDMSVNEC